tara:strand:- start:19705 stop:20151 length:447 start_codon:yes stop_codon:yes gene_type:complete
MSTVQSFDPKKQTPAEDSLADEIRSKTALPDEGVDYDSFPDAIELTDAAVAQIKLLLADEEDNSTRLRVFIQGGGCSGFQYGFVFDDEQADDDETISKDGVELLVDVMSLQYLSGSSIDYKADASGEQFVISNPNAQTTCGCGSSFSV